jgi:hypothetical protein
MGYEGHYINVEKVKTWSKDRIKAEIDDLKDEIQTQKEEIRRMEEYAEEYSFNDPRFEKNDRNTLLSETIIENCKADIQFLMSLL